MGLHDNACKFNHCNTCIIDEYGQSEANVQHYTDHYQHEITIFQHLRASKPKCSPVMYSRGNYLLNIAVIHARSFCILNFRHFNDNLGTNIIYLTTVIPRCIAIKQLLLSDNIQALYSSQSKITIASHISTLIAISIGYVNEINKNIYIQE